jgi:hypothetical protein
MTAKDWLIQLLAAIVLGLWFALIMAFRQPGVTYVIWTLLGVFVSGAIVGFRSVRNLGQAVVRGSIPVFIVTACLLPILGMDRLAGPGGGRYLIAAIFVCPASILGASISAWARSSRKS